LDRRERYPNIYSWIQAQIDAALNQTFVSMPGIVQSFDATDCTAAVQIAVLYQNRDQNNNWQNITPSPIIPKALVQFPGNKNFLYTFPIVKGDEGLLVFCDRCIDAFYQQGGVQPQMDIRQHDITDAIFIPGIKSIPNVPSNINTTSAELRTFSGNTRITLDDTNGIVITGNATINGVLTVSQGIAAGYGGADLVTVQNHIHAANGDPPTPGH